MDQQFRSDKKVQKGEQNLKKKQLKIWVYAIAKEKTQVALNVWTLKSKQSVDRKKRRSKTKQTENRIKFAQAPCRNEERKKSAWGKSKNPGDFFLLKTSSLLLISLICFLPLSFFTVVDGLSTHTVCFVCITPYHVRCFFISLSSFFLRKKQKALDIAKITSVANRFHQLRQWRLATKPPPNSCTRKKTRERKKEGQRAVVYDSITWCRTKV